MRQSNIGGAEILFTNMYVNLTVKYEAQCIMNNSRGSSLFIIMLCRFPYHYTEAKYSCTMVFFVISGFLDDLPRMVNWT